MGVIRTLTTVLRLKADDAFKGIKLYDQAMKGLDKSVQTVASSIEKSAQKMAASLASIAAGAADVKNNMPSGGGGGRTPPWEYGASGKFKAGAGRSVGDLGKVAADFTKVEKEAGKAAKAVSSVTVAMGSLISAGVQWAGGKLVDGLKFAANSAIEFESSMADVAKVIDGLKTPTGEVTQKYKDMEQEIFQLTRTMPVAAKGFADIYAAAGQAGIAEDELKRFSEQAAKVSVAFGISAGEASESMGQLRTALGLTQDEVESLQGTFNVLDNNLSGVAAGDIQQIVARVGSLAKVAGVAGQEVAAFGGAMKATGVDVDVAATASKNYLLAMTVGERATTKQAEAFKRLGFDAADVAKRFTESGESRLKVQQELFASIEKLGKVSKDEALGVLSDIYKNESAPAIAAVASNLELFDKAMGLALNTTKAATSVQEEYDTRSKTTANSIQLLKNNAEVFAIQLGNHLLPVINKVSAWLASPDGQEWGKKAIDGAISAVTKLVEIAQALWPILQTIGGVIATVADSLGLATTAALAFAAKLALLGGPAGAIAALGVAAVAVGYKLGEYLFAPAETAADRFGKKVNEVMSAALVKINEVLTKTRDAMKEQNDALAKENARRQKIVAAGFSDADMKAWAGVAGNAARNEYIRSKLGSRAATLDAKRSSLTDSEAAEYEKLTSKLSNDQREELKLRTQKAIVDSKSDYMDAAEKAGGGNPAREQQKAEERVGKQARFEYLDKNRKSLKPSEKAEYNKLSKELDVAKTKSGGSRKGPEHFASDNWDEDKRTARFDELRKKGKGRKPSEDREYNKLSKELDLDKDKMSKSEKQLANLDPALAGVLKDGGDGDGGVGVHDDILSKGVFARATKGHGQFGEVSSERSSVAGPNINNVYNNQQISTMITQYIDATQGGGGSDGLKAAANNVAQGAGKIVFTGVAELLGLSNGGGKMA